MNVNIDVVNYARLISIYNIFIYFGKLIVCGYIAYLLIKALRIYIRKNS